MKLMTVQKNTLKLDMAAVLCCTYMCLACCAVTHTRSSHVAHWAYQRLPICPSQNCALAMRSIVFSPHSLSQLSLLSLFSPFPFSHSSLFSLLSFSLLSFLFSLSPSSLFSLSPLIFLSSPDEVRCSAFLSLIKEQH